MNRASLLEHECGGVPRDLLHLPGPDFVERVWGGSDRPLGGLQALFRHGRLGGTGYLSILPVDHGIAFSGGSAFAPNPAYFDPVKVVELAVEGGCSAVVTTFGLLGAVARRYAHAIPLILKINHHETLSYPNRPDQVLFARVREAHSMGCVAVAATVYFGSPGSRRQLREVSDAFAEAHALGMVTILFCYLHNEALRGPEGNLEVAIDLTAQANHLGASIEADLVKQKLPSALRGFELLGGNDGNGYGGSTDTTLIGEHLIDLVRYQVANAYMGRCGLINSGGGSGRDDLHEAVRSAIINKRGGGMGLLAGRKAFQRPMHEGVELLHAIQDVYLDTTISVA